MRAGFLSSSGKPKLKPLATPKQDREARERKRKEKLAQDRCEAYWCLVTHGIKAQCWWEMQLEASEGLKARAVATMVAPPGWRRSSIVPAPATPGQGGLTRVLRDRLSAMRADLLPGRL